MGSESPSFTNTLVVVYLFCALFRSLYVCLCLSVTLPQFPGYLTFPSSPATLPFSYTRFSYPSSTFPVIRTKSASVPPQQIFHLIVPSISAVFTVFCMFLDIVTEILSPQISSVILPTLGSFNKTTQHPSFTSQLITNFCLLRILGKMQLFGY